MEIEGQGGLEVRASVDPQVAALLRPGSKVRALCDGQPEPQEATITAVAPAGDLNTHRFEVKAALRSAPGLRAGTFARLLVPAPAGEARLRVPQSAVFPRGGLNGLFVADDGTARLRWVALGERTGEHLHGFQFHLGAVGEVLINSLDQIHFERSLLPPAQIIAQRRVSNAQEFILRTHFVSTRYKCRHSATLRRSGNPVFCRSS